MGSKYRSLELLEQSVKGGDMNACFFLNGGRVRLSSMISSFLKDNNMTMVEFAKRSGSSEGWLSTYKLGKHKGISVHAMYKIAKSMNMSPTLLAQQVFLKPAMQPIETTNLELPVVPVDNDNDDAPVVYVTVDGMQFVIESLEGVSEPVVVERAGWRIAMTPV